MTPELMEQTRSEIRTLLNRFNTADAYFEQPDLTAQEIAQGDQLLHDIVRELGIKAQAMVDATGGRYEIGWEAEEHGIAL